MALLTVDILSPADLVVVRATGDIDMDTSGSLRTSLRAAPAGVLAIDLSGVRFFSAAGLHVLLGERARRRRCGHELVVVGAPHCVHLVLRITGADLPSLPTLGDAVATIPRPRSGSAAPRTAVVHARAGRR